MSPQQSLSVSLGATPYCQDSSLSRGAKTNHDEHHKDFTTHRYTNGSGIDEKIGATAVTLEHGIRLGAYIRPQGQYSVFDGEAHGLEIAMEQLSNDTQLTPAAIHVDNRVLHSQLPTPMPCTSGLYNLWKSTGPPTMKEYPETMKPPSLPQDRDLKEREP